VVAETAWAAVVDEFGASDQALSRFREDSQVSALNEASLRGEALAVGHRLAAAVHACDRARRLTGGRFDPRVIGQLDAWGYRGASLGAPVSTALVGAPERLVDRLDRARIRLPHPVDLGGIGKGLAVRWATDRVLATGVQRFLLDAGGDIAAHGKAPEGGPWLVAIEDPASGDDPLAVVALRDGAIATSSIRRLRWTTDGGERHHIVDPRTGEPADGGLLAVTVAAADPAWAEVWSKALFVAGRAAIAGEARAHGLAAWWVDRGGAIEMTAAARQCTTWVAGEA
jgi:thiamine biosynthesis lipoprotein